ncbi:hypothetical protein ACIQW7_27995 [Peribacillus simplex]|uniref:hypothetical protein n=1 Tax=Peribacillus simplex TaxID=1478 RepID=UPI0038305156
MEFNHTFASISPKEFIRKYIIGLHAIHLVAGVDSYGALAKGNMQTIEKDGEGMFQVTTIAKLASEGEKISST